VDPVRSLLLSYFAQCVHRIGASLVGRSAAPRIMTLSVSYGTNRPKTSYVATCPITKLV